MQGIVSSVPLLRRRRGGVCSSGVSSMASTVDERRLLGLPGAVVVGSSFVTAAAIVLLAAGALYRELRRALGGCSADRELQSFGAGIRGGLKTAAAFSQLSVV
jgi:hypothetical protein